MIPWWSLLIFLPAVFYAGACLGRWLNSDGDWRLKALEKSALAMAQHAESVQRNAHVTETATQSLLFNAYRTMAGQSRGLQRQRRIINRLRAELKPPIPKAEPHERSTDR